MWGAAGQGRLSYKWLPGPLAAFKHRPPKSRILNILSAQLVVGVGAVDWVLSALEQFWVGWEPSVRCLCPLLCSHASVGLVLFQAILCSSPLKALKYWQMVPQATWAHEGPEVSAWPLVPPALRGLLILGGICNPSQGRMTPWSCQWYRRPSWRPLSHHLSQEGPAPGKPFCQRVLASAHKLVVCWLAAVLAPLQAFGTISLLSLSSEFSGESCTDIYFPSLSRKSSNVFRAGLAGPRIPSCVLKASLLFPHKIPALAQSEEVVSVDLVTSGPPGSSSVPGACFTVAR